MRYKAQWYKAAKSKSQWHPKVVTVELGPPTQYRRNRLASLNLDTQCRTDEEHGKVQHCSSKEQIGLHILNRSISGFELPHLLPRRPIQVTNNNEERSLLVSLLSITHLSKTSQGLFFFVLLSYVPVHEECSFLPSIPWIAQITLMH